MAVERSDEDIARMLDCANAYPSESRCDKAYRRLTGAECGMHKTEREIVRAGQEGRLADIPELVKKLGEYKKMEEEFLKVFNAGTQRRREAQPGYCSSCGRHD